VAVVTFQIGRDEMFGDLLRLCGRAAGGDENVGRKGRHGVG